MAAKTAAQEEFDDLVEKNSRAAPSNRHPEDERAARCEEPEEADEETTYRAAQVNADMGALSIGGGAAGRLVLPDRSFDEGRTTGVKGVIADARAYEQAKRDENWRGAAAGRDRNAGRINASSGDGAQDGGAGYVERSAEEEDEEFLERWRESRRQEIAREGNDIRNRRTSPSVRRYGRFDEVDALGYLDAIEKVGRETIVVVFVYDHESAVSQVIEQAIEPLVAAYPAIHFVKVHCDDIEFDSAGVPAILGYRNQGDLFANLTYIIGQIPDDTIFDTAALKDVLRKHHVL